MDLSYIDVRLFTSKCSSEMINRDDKSASNDLASILWIIRFLATVFSAFVLFCNTCNVLYDGQKGKVQLHNRRVCRHQVER